LETSTYEYRVVCVSKDGEEGEKFDLGNDTVQITSAFAKIREFGTSMQEGTQIAVLSNGNLAIADYSQDTIRVFDSTGTPLFHFGGTGTGNGQFDHPIGITTDDSDNIYVTELLGAGRVQQFDKDGNFLHSWTVGTYHRGIAYLNGKLYVTSQNSTIKTIAVAAGIVDSVQGPFSESYGIVAAANGYLCVVSDEEYKVYLIDTLGQAIRSWGEQTKQWPDKIIKGEIGKFGGPTNLALSPQGGVYVCDRNGGRVQVFDSTGAFVSQFGYGTFEQGNANMIVDAKGYVFGSGFQFLPAGIGFNGNGDIYVVLGSKIMQFRPK
jgi:DNA-binding beta-propeller fold protein YncE